MVEHKHTRRSPVPLRPQRELSAGSDKGWVRTVAAWVVVWFVWYCLYTIVYRCSLQIDQQGASGQVGSYTYDVVYITRGAVMSLLTTVLTIPLVGLLFKRLRFKRPLIMATVVPLSLVFGLSLFTVLLDIVPSLYDVQRSMIVVVLGATLLLSAVAYAVMVRAAVRRQLSSLLIVLFAVGPPLILGLADIMYRLSLTPLL